MEKTQAELIDSLKAKGFSEKMIISAIERSPFLNEEAIVEEIEKFINNPDLLLKEEKAKQEFLEIINERKLEKQKDKEYLEKIKQQIKENRSSKDISIPIKIKQADKHVYGECTIKIRYKNQSKILQFKKTDTTNILYEKVKETFDIKSFTLYTVDKPREVMAGEETLDEVGLVPTGMVVINE